MDTVRHPKKNYLASLIVTLMWWLILGGIVVFVDPKIIANFLLPGGYLIFFLTLFMAVLFSASLILMSSRRGLLAAVGIVILGYLKLWRISNWWNSILLIGLLLAIELYFWGKSDTTTSSDADFKQEVK